MANWNPFIALAVAVVVGVVLARSDNVSTGEVNVIAFVFFFGVMIWLEVLDLRGELHKVKKRG